jgi:sec-independent protein translocase protein TatA
MFGIGGMEWLVILIVALLLFGKRLPEVMRAMGQGVREFKKGMREDEEPPASNQDKDKASSGDGSKPSSPAG